MPKSWESSAKALAEEFDLVEADFQQYYGLDVEEVDFWRYTRLLFQLPAESRFIRAHNPIKDWTWDKEIQSQILHRLDVISCQLANMFRKKGKKPAKPGKQLQPEYVAKAKEQLQEEKKAKTRLSEEETAEVEEFWQARNPNVKFYKGENR